MQCSKKTVECNLEYNVPLDTLQIFSANLLTGAKHPQAEHYNNQNKKTTNRCTNKSTMV